MDDNKSKAGSRKRQQVISKATELFSLYGFHPVGVDRIIDESNVARMTMYRHFTGKDELVGEVLEQRYTFIIESMAEKLLPFDNASDRIKGIFDWYENWFRTPEFAGCLFERALAEFGPSHAGISDVAIRYRLKLQNWMDEIMQEILPAQTAKHLAGVFVMLLDGATVDARAFNDPSVAQRAWQAAEMLLNQATKSTP